MVTAQEPLKHDGETYAPGDEVDMTAEEARENGLVAIGAVEVSEEDDQADTSATDAAAELAEEEGLDLADIDGTGSGGKVLKSDVQDALHG